MGHERLEGGLRQVESKRSKSKSKSKPEKQNRQKQAGGMGCKASS